MRYSLGYKSGLELQTTEKSEPFAVIADGLVTLTVNTGRILVNSVNQGTSANATPGSVVEIEATSSSQFGVPTFVQLRQDGVLEGIFTLINEIEETFVYNDALNGKYAFEVLPESTWVPSDNGRLGIIDTQDIDDQGNTADPTFVDLVDQELDLVDTNIFRNKLHVLDYYLDHVNVFDLQGNYVGRPEHNYSGPIDAATLYSDESASRIFSVIAFERSNKVVLFNNSYDVFSEIDVTAPVAVITRLNDLYIARRNSNEITIVNFDNQGNQTNTSTITLLRQPHRLYLIEGRIAVLTESSIEFIADNNTVEYSITLPQFASSLAYDVLNNVIYVTHRQERNVSQIDLDFAGASPITTRFFEDQGYLDAIVYDRFTDTIWISDVVTRQLIQLDSSLTQLDSIDMIDRHAYEMYFVAGTRKVLFNSLYPDIDERLILGDGDPDAQEYFDVEGIIPGQTVESPAYSISGVRDPVTLYMYPDDSDVQVSVRVPTGSFTSGTVINPTDEFKFEVGLPGGRSRKIQFVLGQTVYEFFAIPDNRRVIPVEEIYEPLEAVEPDIDVISQTNTVTDLDVPSVDITTDGNSVLYVNGTENGTSATLSNGDQWYLSARSGANFCDRIYTTVDYAGLFQSTWVITTRSEGSVSENRPQLTDFIDVLNADLGTVVTSLPVRVSIPDGGSAQAEINGDYGAELLVNGVNQGQSATVNDTDNIRIRLTTTFVYDTDHQITLSFCKRSITWVVKTIPAIALVPLEFGFVDGVTLGDRVESDPVVLETIDSRLSVNVIIPRNTKAFVNGQPYPFAADQLNYRDVVRVPTVIEVRGQDEIYLEGYANGVYGSVTQHKISAGISVGYWSIRSISTGDALPSRESFALLGRQAIAQVQAMSVAQGQNAVVDDTVCYLSSGAQAAPSFFHEQTSRSASSITSRDTVNFLVAKEPGIYSKVNQPRLTLDQRTDALKALPHGIKVKGTVAQFQRSSTHIHVFDGLTATRRANGIYVLDTVFDFIKQTNSMSIEFKGNFVKQTSGIHLTDAPGFGQPRRQNTHVITDLEYERYNGIATVEPENLSYERYFGIPVNEVAIDYFRYDGPETVNVNIEYQKTSAPEVNNVEINYVRYGNNKITNFEEAYQGRSSREITAFNVPYQKQSGPKVNELDLFFRKRDSHTIAETPLWLDTIVDTTALNSQKVLNETVKASVGDLPLKVINTQYNLTTESSSAGWKVVGNMPNVVEGGLYSHQVVGQQVTTFVPVDTFTVAVMDWKQAVITEDDCATLGNEDCLTAGYFATEQDAIDNAVNVWQVPLTVIRTNEVNPGCWIWSQRLPCTNSCYGCPPTGYIHGG